MFSLLAAQDLFLVSNRRYSGEILLLLHNKYRAARLRIGILFELDVIVHSVWTVYVCERAMLNMITDANGVCVWVCLNVWVCVCGYVGRQDRRSAGRDNCSNLSSPSHSHPSAQTSKSLPLGLPCTHTQAHNQHMYTHSRDPHINPIPNSHFGLRSSPKSKAVVVDLREMDVERRGMDNKCISSALSSRGYHLLMRCMFTHACTYSICTCALTCTGEHTHIRRERESWSGVD